MPNLYYKSFFGNPIIQTTDINFTFEHRFIIQWKFANMSQNGLGDKFIFLRSFYGKLINISLFISEPLYNLCICPRLIRNIYFEYALGLYIIIPLYFYALVVQCTKSPVNSNALFHCLIWISSINISFPIDNI